MESNELSFSNQPCSSVDTRRTISSVEANPGSPSIHLLPHVHTSDSECSDRTESSSTSESKLSPKGNIFDAFRQIRSELKVSLKAFENNNIYLTNKLSQLLQEIELQKRKRELQKRTLVDLQMKSENLDQMKQVAIEKCLSIKRAHLSGLNKEYTEISENDKYLSETMEKMKHLLETDKADIASFSNEVLQEFAKQIKYSQEYEAFAEQTRVAYNDRIKAAIEEERIVEVELEEAIQLSKNTSGLTEKYEYEVQEKFSNLKLIENEVEVLRLKMVQCKEQLNEVLESNHKMEEERVEKCCSYATEIARKEKLVEAVRKDVEAKSAELSLKESNLNEAIEEHKRLLSQISEAESQIENGKTEICDFMEQFKELNNNIEEGKLKLKELEESVFELGGVHQLERELVAAKDVIMEKLSVKTTMVRDLENKFALVEDKWFNVESKFDATRSAEEEIKNRNEAAKNDLDELLARLGEVKDANKLKMLEGELDELKARSRTLKEQIDVAEGKLTSATVEIGQLNDENSALDGELSEVSERESHVMNNWNHFDGERRRLEGLKTQILDVKEEIERIKTTREMQLKVDHLEEEVRKVKQEIEGKKQKHETQKEAAESLSKQTIRNLQEQMDELKKASNEEMMRRQARTDRYETNLTQLHQDIAGYKRELVQTSEKNIEMMKERLKVTNRLVEGYRALQAKSQSADGTDFTVLRLLGTIEEHLASSFRGMIEYLQLGPVDLSTPSYLIYRRTLEAFEKRFYSMIAERNKRLTDPSYLADLKTAAFCLFGLRRYTQVTAGSESTFFSPNSSSVHDY